MIWNNLCHAMPLMSTCSSNESIIGVFFKYRIIQVIYHCSLLVAVMHIQECQHSEYFSSFIRINNYKCVAKCCQNILVLLQAFHGGPRGVAKQIWGRTFIFNSLIYYEKICCLLACLVYYSDSVLTDVTFTPTT